MKNNKIKVATAQTGESVQTDAVHALPPPPTAPDGTTKGNAKVTASADATTTQSLSISATPDRRPKAEETAYVASQQKPQTGGIYPAPAGMFPTVDYSKHTDDQLHQSTVAALANYAQKRGDAENYAYDVLIPAINQVIERYKQQGRAMSYRLNGCPTVEDYFESIGLNYSTVRSWKSRAQQRLLQAAVYAGTKPTHSTKPDPVAPLNKAARRALIEGNHRAVELVAALEAGRDAKKEVAEFKVVMNAKRLDDILQIHQLETDYKSILTKILQTVVRMKSSLPPEFIKDVIELTKVHKSDLTMPSVPTKQANGTVKAKNATATKTSTSAKTAGLAPATKKSHSPSPLMTGRKYTVRVAASGGYGIFEPDSPVCLQKHSTMDAAWAAIDELTMRRPSIMQTSTV